MIVSMNNNKNNNYYNNNNKEYQLTLKIILKWLLLTSNYFDRETGESISSFLPTINSLPKTLFELKNGYIIIARVVLCNYL